MEDSLEIITKKSAEGGPYLLVVIPCLNEEKTVGSVIRGVPTQIPGIARIEVVVIDDGSDDKTAGVARAEGARVVRHHVNLGLGKTFQHGVEIALAAGADILVNIDGDGQFDASNISKLVESIVRGDAEMVTASRFARPDVLPRMPAIKKWGNRNVARIVTLLSGRRFHDVSCGFRAFSKEALLRMNLFGSFTYTQESFLDLVFKDLAIREIPLKVRGVREFGKSRVASNLPRYAIRSLQIMSRAFIAYRPFIFFSVIAAVFLATGFGFLLFLGLHYLETGAFSPHIWAGFVGGSIAFIGLMTIVLGFLGDMLVRIRLNQEELLYFMKLSTWEKARSNESK